MNNIVAWQVIEGHGKTLLEFRVSPDNPESDCKLKAEVCARLMASDGVMVRICPVVCYKSLRDSDKFTEYKFTDEGYYFNHIPHLMPESAC